jgi:hypothetical protein
MAKSGKKAAHALILAKKLVRLKRADGGETDPLMDSDYTSPPDKPNYVMSTEATKPVLTPNTFYERANSVLKERARDFGQGLSEMPGQAWEAIKYPMQALRGETSRAVDPNTGKIVDVSPSGMTGDEAAMVGAGLVSTGALPDIMAGKVTPNVMRAGAASDRAVNLAKAPRSDLGFYSHGAETAANLPQPKGTADQMISMLRNQGVKPAELENAGLITSEGAIHPDWAGKPMTREELSQHLQQSMPQVEETTLGATLHSIEYNKLKDAWLKDFNTLDEAGYTYNPKMIDQYPPELQDTLSRMVKIHDEMDAMGHPNLQSTKFDRYTLPGGENYREVALTLPGDEVYRAPSVHSMGNEADVNRLAHIRMSDRAGPNGEKLLHVEELQSDWGQTGKKEGFDPPEMRAKLLKELPEGYVVEHAPSPQGVGSSDRYYVSNEQGRLVGWGYTRDSAINSTVNDLNDQIKGVPTSPYVTSTQGWTDLALKRVMKEAAEGGYDGVVFTPGTEQAKRYDLSNTVDRIGYNPDTKELNYVKKNSQSGPESHPQNVDPKDLPSLVGKEVADKLLNSKPNNLGFHVLAGDEMTVGGEGMKGYYDKIAPTQLQKMVKGYDKDVKLGQMAVPIEGKNKMPMLHMPMTDKMRQSILSGQKAFKKGGRINPASGNATKDEKMEQFGHKVKESKKINPLIDTALMLVSRKT